MSDFELVEEEGKDITFEDLNDGDLGDFAEPTPKSQEQAGEPEPKEDEVEQKEEPEQPVKQAKAPVEAAKKTDEQKFAEDLITYVGKDQKLKVKGKEYALTDFKPEDYLGYLRKGVRFEQGMAELAAQRAALEQEAMQKRALLDRAAQQAEYLLSQRGGVAGGSPAQGGIPAELQPSEDDTPEMASIKRFNIQLRQELDQVRSGLEARSYEDADYQIAREVNTLNPDYPLADVDSVVALRKLFPQANTESLMAKSHAYYNSEAFVKRVLEHNPEARKAIQEAMVADYLAKKSGAKNAPTRRMGSAKPPTETRTKVTEDPAYDFEKAGALAKARIKKAIEAGEEEEFF